MCMFHDKPPKERRIIPLSKPRWAYKAFRLQTTYNHLDKLVTIKALSFTDMRSYTLQLDTWMKAIAPSYDTVANGGGFHVFTTERAAKAYLRMGYSHGKVVRVRVRGRVYATGKWRKHSGYRVAQLFVPNPFTRKKAKRKG